MSNIKDQIVTLLKQRHHNHKVALEQEKDPRSKHAVDLIARIREDSKLIELIDSIQQGQQEVDLEEEMSKELRLHYNDDQDVYWWNYLKNSFRHFYELGLNARK